MIRNQLCGGGETVGIRRKASLLPVPKLISRLLLSSYLHSTGTGCVKGIHTYLESPPTDREGGDHKKRGANSRNKEVLCEEEMWETQWVGTFAFLERSFCL